MKKILLILSLIGLYLTGNAQYDYKLNGRMDVPVLGGQSGFVGGGFTAMLKNRDDMDADQRLDLEMMNFSYAGGYDQMWWFQPTFGFGFQLLYWKAGGAYSGLDTLNNFELKGNTSLTYLKVPLLFHFKSYNRYYPDRAVRFNASFGPYIALLNSFSDSYNWYNLNDPLKSQVYGGSISGRNVKSSSFGVNNNVGVLQNPIVNPLDLGFVVAVGGEIRITRRTVLSFTFRTDIGITDVENKKGNKIKYTGSTVDQDFNYWKPFIAKYTPANGADVLAGWEPNRPATKNLSFGAFVTYKKYLRK